MVKVNGQNFELAGKTVEAYLATTKYDKTRIAVEINCEIVPKASYDTTVIKDQDSIEVVSFVGGG